MASDKKVVFITGGNRGIGYEVVKALYESPEPYEILLGTRTLAKGEAAIQRLQSEAVPGAPATSVRAVQADLESDASLAAAVAAAGPRLDALVHNGGASFGEGLAAGALTERAAFRRAWDVNVAGAQVLTTLAAPRLLASPDPRLLFLTSGTATLAGHEAADASTPNLARLHAPPPPGWPKHPAHAALVSYRAAKTGLNMVMREWHRLLRADGVKVWAISPGHLATGLVQSPEVMRQMGAGEAWRGGHFIRDVIQGKRDHDVGKAIRPDMVQPW
ncbi:NAD(P)-binding protein [Xylariomycetidae sp. FL0641]|nr:NAD(P)-binding protein [Xylariomycetidae sp. FL0641]